MVASGFSKQQKPAQSVQIRSFLVTGLFLGLMLSGSVLGQSNSPQIEQRLSTLLACDDQELVSKQLDIRESIADARFCESDADCQLINPGCPFGCLVGVRKDRAPAITQALGDYREQATEACGSCTYECPEQDDVKCLDNFCTPVQTR